MEQKLPKESEAKKQESKKVTFLGMLVSSKTRFRLYFAFWLAIGISFAVAFLAQSYRFDALLAQEAELLRQIEAARKVTYELEQDLRYHYTDAFVERVARERLGFIRADETVFINDAR